MSERFVFQDVTMHPDTSSFDVLPQLNALGAEGYAVVAVLPAYKTPGAVRILMQKREAAPSRVDGGTDGR